MGVPSGVPSGVSPEEPSGESFGRSVLTVAKGRCYVMHSCMSQLHRGTVFRGAGPQDLFPLFFGEGVSETASERFEGRPQAPFSHLFVWWPLGCQSAQEGFAFLDHTGTGFGPNHTYSPESEDCARYARPGTACETGYGLVRTLFGDLHPLLLP